MDNTVKQRELQNCGTVKTLMMLAVVICHCATACAGGTGWFTIGAETHSPVLNFISAFTGLYHVQTFMFVSGYLFYYLKYELGKYSDPVEFIKKKSLRLLAPYLFACVWVVPAYVCFFKPDVLSTVRKFVLGENPSQLWFLLALFWIYIGFFFFSRFLDRFNFFDKMSFRTAVLLLIFFFCIGFSGYILCSFNVNPFYIFMGIKYLPVFFAGFIFRKFDFEKLRKFSIPFFFASATATVLYIYFARGPVRTFLQIPLWVFNSTAVFVFLTKYLKPAKSRLFRLLQKYNFTIYLIHQQAIYVIIYLLSRFWKIYPLPSFAISLAGSIVISVALSALFARFRFTRTVLGLKQ